MQFSFLASISVSGFCLLFLNSPAGADDLTEILKAGRKIQVEEVTPLRLAGTRALAGVSASIQRQSQIVTGIKLLDKQPPDSRRNEIKRLKERLALLEHLESIYKGDADARVAALAKAEEKLVEFRKERAKVDAPTQQKFRDMYRKYADRHKELAAAMTDYFPEKGLGELDGLTRKSINGQFHDCSAYTLYYQDGQAACQISVHYRPDLKAGTPVEKIADGIELLTISDRNASLKVGQFQVSFYTQQPTGWDKERIKLAVKQLINLEGLAKIKLE